MVPCVSRVLLLADSPPPPMALTSRPAGGRFRHDRPTRYLGVPQAAATCNLGRFANADKLNRFWAESLVRAPSLLPSGSRQM
jgi:hypothetical protein